MTVAELIEKLNEMPSEDTLKCITRMADGKMYCIFPEYLQFIHYSPEIIALSKKYAD